MLKGDDYNYIIKIINYLNEKHKISFFITSSDFDILYGWWIKRIPENILHESIDNVIKRWKRKNKIIDGFKRFSYEVRKNFNNFLELKVSQDYNINGDSIVKADNSIDHFINTLPDILLPIKDRLLLLNKEKVKLEKQKLLDNISEKLLELHKDDPELELKTKKFLMNLNKQIRTQEMENRYRINNLFSKYKFPEVLLFFSDTDDIG